MVASQTIAAREVPYSDVFSHYADSITRITTCGSWTKGESSGKYRVIELYMEAQTFLYVDKVTINSSQTEFAVTKGITIGRFDDDHVDIELRGIRCVPAKGGIRIYATAESGQDLSVKKVRIDVRASDDSYSVHAL